MKPISFKNLKINIRPNDILSISSIGADTFECQVDHVSGFTVHLKESVVLSDKQVLSKVVLVQNGFTVETVNNKVIDIFV